MSVAALLTTVLSQGSSILLSLGVLLHLYLTGVALKQAYLLMSIGLAVNTVTQTVHLLVWILANYAVPDLMGVPLVTETYIGTINVFFITMINVSTLGLFHVYSDWLSPERIVRAKIFFVLFYCICAVPTFVDNVLLYYEMPNAARDFIYYLSIFLYGAVCIFDNFAAFYITFLVSKNCKSKNEGERYLQKTIGRILVAVSLDWIGMVLAACLTAFGHTASNHSPDSLNYLNNIGVAITGLHLAIMTLTFSVLRKMALLNAKPRKQAPVQFAIPASDRSKLEDTVAEVQSLARPKKPSSTIEMHL
ncbi:hypothetical protein HDV03_002713 [Kappamyces sp. JEL0829]|nr:hypothetical protein HDV03_002713 [Kappamyces sp. JEL0829]